ncbi:MAG: hypothetical protein GPJ52_02810 [Candidatus Heimdallarchaeota archaeon]|nr:hypothetical protein [Candidatus Heimdallarchaeota archaeon]
MATQIEIWSLVLGFLGLMGVGFGIYNFVKSFLIRPKPTIIAPVITESFTPVEPAFSGEYEDWPTERVLKLYFEVRNNGDSVTRLYLNGTLKLVEVGNVKFTDVKPKDDSGNITVTPMMLEPHRISPTSMDFRLPKESKVINEGIVEFGNYYYNHKNKYKEFKQKFSFKKESNEWKVEEIKENRLNSRK